MISNVLGNLILSAVLLCWSIIMLNLKWSERLFYFAIGCLILSFILLTASIVILMTI